MLGTARAPGTCGELIQGKIAGTSFLVTCPIDMYSVVSVLINKTGQIEVDRSLPKVKKAIIKTLEFLGMPSLGAKVEVKSFLPHGKGMASSTADITAACAATAVGAGGTILPWDIARIALEIEPTDGIMFSGIAMFDHLTGSISRVLGRAPKLEAVIVDLGGGIDTVGFNANLRTEAANEEKEQLMQTALAKIEASLQGGDLRLLGEACTESAFANQDILFKPELRQIHQIARESGAIGVNAAHSGTILGILLEKDKCITDLVVENLRREGFCQLLKADIIDGGVDVLQERDGDKQWTALAEFMAGTCEMLRKNTV